eukprot:10552746-Ditylum_brightwellii.AAC.1
MKKRNSHSVMTAMKKVMKIHNRRRMNRRRMNNLQQYKSSKMEKEKLSLKKSCRKAIFHLMMVHNNKANKISVQISVNQ